MSRIFVPESVPESLPQVKFEVLRDVLISRAEVLRLPQNLSQMCTQITNVYWIAALFFPRITDRYWLSLGQGSLFRQSIDTARGSCSLWRGAAGRSRGWRGAGGRSRTRTGTAAARGTTGGASVERMEEGDFEGESVMIWRQHLGRERGLAQNTISGCLNFQTTLSQSHLLSRIEVGIKSPRYFADIV